MSYKKYTTPPNSVFPVQKNRGNNRQRSSYNSYSSWLPELYNGPADRLKRYGVYETMNMDNEISAALDTIADFCTQEDNTTKLPFQINYHADPSSTESYIIQQALRQWCVMNQMKSRLWDTFRMTLMYGDQIFIRDPDTHKLMWVDVNNILEVYVDEAAGMKPIYYKINGIDPNLKHMVASTSNKTTTMSSIIYSQPSASVPGAISYNLQNSADIKQVNVDAKHIVHLSLSTGMNKDWPFGNSILEHIHKVFKQKELLEDSVIIYRVHRAPERRAFFIDVGDNPPHIADQILERSRYEIQQKRIPSRTGGGNSITDSTYNPMSMLEDYFFAVTPEGRGSRVETLPGGENLGSIDDLRYFNNKMLRALGVPSSYLPTGPEDGSASQDARLGTQFIQEFRFSKVCERFQNRLIPTLDTEFKLFLKKKGVTVDNSLFSISFVKPESFSEFRQLELDAVHINTFLPLAEIPFISKRFIMSRYLGWSEDEIHKNEKMWREENNILEKSASSTHLRDSGIGSASIESMPDSLDDFTDGDDFDMGSDEDFDQDDTGDLDQDLELDI